MLTLQTSFTYLGTEPAPVDRATVAVGFPRYEAVDDTQTQSVTLSVPGRDEIDFQQKLSSKNYLVSIPIEKIFGENYGEVLIKYLSFLTRAAGGPKISLDDLTIPFSVRYGAGDNATTATFDALYFITQANLNSRAVIAPSFSAMAFTPGSAVVVAPGVLGDATTTTPRPATGSSVSTPAVIVPGALGDASDTPPRYR